MAEYKFTGALNAAAFPLTTRAQQRSVMIGQLDGVLRDPRATPQSYSDNNPQNVPQIIYCENILPTADGCTTVGYTERQAAFPGAGVADDLFIVRHGPTQTFATFCPAQGMNYITSAFGTPWVSTNPLAGAPLAGIAGQLVSLGEVNGITYVNYFENSLLQWDGTAFVDCAPSIIGIVAGNIRAICSSGNYLIVVYADDSIKWSSLTDPLDFTPSTVTGAGSQIPIDMKGPPLFVSSVAGGFLIHSAVNTVAAVYTQNVAQPWIFREVKNSGGISALTYAYAGVTRESSTGSIYMYGQYGLQSLNLRDADVIHPQVTDFIASKIIESFDEVTSLLSITRVTEIFTKLAFIGGRYLCVSYGTANGAYNYCLFYDNALHRWGKLKVDHADIFSLAEALDIYQLFFVLKADGSCHKIVLDSEEVNDDGVLILGRYQLNRTNMLCSQELELEVLDANDNVTVQVAANYNGTTLGELQTMSLYNSTDNYRYYQKQIEAENISFILTGSFTLSTFLITATKGAASGS